MKTHTPGPWEIRPIKGELRSELLVIGGYTEHGNEIFVADCGISRNYRTLEEAQANAKLVSLAPEMFEALRQFDKLFWPASNGWADDTQDLISDVHAILARLEGNE